MRMYPGLKRKSVLAVGMLLLALRADAGMVSAMVGPVPFGPAAAPLPIAGVDAATGYAYDGIVTDGAACGAGMVGAGVLQVCLTDLTVVRPVPMGGPPPAGGFLRFGFSENFPGPIPAGFANDHIDGAFGGPLALAPGGDQINWQGFANGVNIAPPPPPGAGVVFFTAADPPVAFAGGHGPLPVAATPVGGFLQLSGTFSVSLLPGDTVNLPNSAIVAFSPAPEPATLFVVSLSILALFRIHRRRAGIIASYGHSIPMCDGSPGAGVRGYRPGRRNDRNRRRSRVG